MRRHRSVEPRSIEAAAETPSALRRHRSVEPISTLEAAMTSPTEMSPPESEGQAEGAKKPAANSRAALRTAIGGAEGYHGLRLPSGPRNKRLYGTPPCMRSSVDDVVFGRDMDLSGADNELSHEMQFLVNNYLGAAGTMAAMGDLMGKPTLDMPKYCCKPHYSMNHNWSEFAGRKNAGSGEGGYMPRCAKKLWPASYDSSVAKDVLGIVYGEPKKGNLQRQKAFESQYYNSGGVSGLFKKTPDDRSAPNSKRAFPDAPMSNSTLHQVINADEPVDRNRRHWSTDDYLKAQFKQAAGKSERFHRHGDSIVVDDLRHCDCSIFR